MTVDGPTVTLGLAAAGVIGSWFVMGYRLREVEKKCAKIEALREHLTEIDARTRDSAVSQGGRLEKATVELAILTGKVEGIDIGLAAAARRYKTAATGNAKAPA
jgi:hypothetical protein